MARYIPALAVLLLSAGAASADGDKVVIRWHGQSFFEIISTKGTRIVIDPHAIDAYHRPQVKADLILMTHFHVDHVAVDAVTNVKEAKQINALKKGEMGRDAWNIIDAKFKDVRIQTVGTFHDDMAGTQRGKNGVFVIDVDGLRIVHLGDLGHQLRGEQLNKIRKVDDKPREQHPIDVLMIPVGGVYTINGLVAQTVVEQLKPTRLILPMHYGTRVYTELLDLTYFLDDQKMGKVERFPRSNEIALDPKSKPPEQPIIAILNWEKAGRKE
ncbi:MAG TPA: MBL fold metallo-hydrolase [Gemmataceae bacterium]|nr:MBL fold metallo-hydrolase [Gemmataceae bacterium]